MKRLLWKIPGMIAVVITLWSVALAVASLVASIGYEWSGEGIGHSFRLWVYSVMVAILSLLFYVIDTAICIKIAVQGEKRLFHILLSVLLLGGIPMVVFVGGWAYTLTSVIWNVYYFAMATLEVVSVVIFWREKITVDLWPKLEYTQNVCPDAKDEDPISPHFL